MATLYPIQSSTLHRPIDAIIFDIGNVLLKFDYSLAIHAIVSRNKQSSPPKESQVFQLRDSHERGDLTHADFLAQVRLLFSDQGTEEEFIKDWAAIFEPNQPMIDFVKARAELNTHPLYLLSNIGKIHADYIQNTYAFLEHFEGAAFSYKLSSMKPEAAIFNRTSEKFALEKAHVLFIDDRLENVLAAQRHGWTSLHYDY
ncbi:MAG: HAD family hydrolase, partial [Chthoniobacterales bacterium]